MLEVEPAQFLKVADAHGLPYFKIEKGW